MADGDDTYPAEFAAELARQMRETIIERAAEMGIPCLATIRQGVAIREAAAFQQSLFEYAPRSKPAQDYLQLFQMDMKFK